MPQNRSVFDVQEKRTQWKEREEPVENLVFLDESAVNINLQRNYGRSIGKKRVVDRAPGSIVVMDNMRSHHIKAVEETLKRQRW